MIFDKSKLTYTAMFCEENIWKLLEHLQAIDSITPQHVLFILNPYNHIAIYEQLESRDSQPAIWDYHVVLSASTDKGPVIFDFDSLLPFPVSLNSYITKSFRHWHQIPADYRAYFRLINPAEYYRYFYSDRSHMRGRIGENEFPDYPIIQPADSQKRLSLNECRFTQDMTDAAKLIEPHKYLETSGS